MCGCKARSSAVRNNVGAAVRGLGISELFAFMLRCAVRQNSQTESEKTTTGKLTCVLQSLIDEFLRCAVVSAYGIAWPWGYRLGWHSQGPLLSSHWGFRELQGGEFPGKKRSVTALRASSWQVGFLASHPNSRDYFAWLSFCFGLFYAKVVYCKIHEHSWECCPHAAESPDRGMVVQRAGHSHLCLSAAERKQAMFFYGSVLSGALCSSMQAPAAIVFQIVGVDSSCVWRRLSLKIHQLFWTPFLSRAIQSSAHLSAHHG